MFFGFMILSILYVYLTIYIIIVSIDLLPQRSPNLKLPIGILFPWH